MNNLMNCDNGLVARHHSQMITDDLVESLTEIGSFFMPKGLMVKAVDYVNDGQTTVPLENNILLAEITSQLIQECGRQVSIVIDGIIQEGFARPRPFRYLLSHSNIKAKVFRGRNNLQIIELHEFLRLEYPPIKLLLTDTLFSLRFFDSGDGAEEPRSMLNGGGCLLLGDSLD